MLSPSADAVRAATRFVVDPELGINVLDLGLIRGVAVLGGAVRVTMTLTSRTCPLGRQLVEEVEAAVTEHVPQATSVAVELVFDPPWRAEHMSQTARAELGV